MIEIRIVTLALIIFITTLCSYCVALINEKWFRKNSEMIRNSKPLTSRHVRGVQTLRHPEGLKPTPPGPSPLEPKE